MSYTNLHKIRSRQLRDLKLVFKTCQRQPTELKLGKLIVHSKFYKICKLENHVKRSNVIMMLSPKTMENNGKCGPPQNQTNYGIRTKSPRTKPPGQNPPDKIPRTKSPWTKSPLGQNLPRTKSSWTKSPQYILYFIDSNIFY